MSARVTAIETRRGTRARRVLLDGEPWRSVPAELVGSLELFEGDMVDVADLSRRITEAEPTFAYRRALAMLSRRDHSITTLTERLRRDGYSPDAIAEAVERLRENRILDETRYAEALLRSLHRRGLGGRRVAAELGRRGLDLEALRVEDSGPSEEERAEATASKLARPGGDVPKLAAKLVRRGFAPALAVRAARRALEQLDGEVRDESNQV